VTDSEVSHTHKIYRFFILPLVFISIGLMVGYTAKTLFFPAPMLTEQSAIPWEFLAKVYDAYQNPETLRAQALAPQIASITGQTVAIYGYMFPLESAEKHAHFLLAARSHSCPSCQPSTTAELVEIHSATALTLRREPVLMKGLLTLSKDTQSGLYFHLSDAELVETLQK
jgi:hypothetical protein